MNRKGADMVLPILMVAAVAIVAGLLLIVFFQEGTSSAKDYFQGSLSDISDDTDGDSVKNTFDKCPCSPGTRGAEFNGCPEGITFVQAAEERKQFNTNDKKCGNIIVGGGAIPEERFSLQILDSQGNIAAPETTEEQLFYQFTCPQQCWLHIITPAGEEIEIVPGRIGETGGTLVLGQEGEYTISLQDSTGSEQYIFSVVKVAEQ